MVRHIILPIQLNLLPISLLFIITGLFLSISAKPKSIARLAKPSRFSGSAGSLEYDNDELTRYYEGFEVPPKTHGAGSLEPGEIRFFYDDEDESVDEFSGSGLEPPDSDMDPRDSKYQSKWSVVEQESKTFPNSHKESNNGLPNGPLFPASDDYFTAENGWEKLDSQVDETNSLIYPSSDQIGSSSGSRKSDSRSFENNWAVTSGNSKEEFEVIVDNSRPDNPFLLSRDKEMMRNWEKSGMKTHSTDTMEEIPEVVVVFGHENSANGDSFDSKRVSNYDYLTHNYTVGSLVVMIGSIMCCCLVIVFMLIFLVSHYRLKRSGK